MRLHLSPHRAAPPDLRDLNAVARIGVAFAQTFHAVEDDDFGALLDLICYGMRERAGAVASAHAWEVFQASAWKERRRIASMGGQRHGGRA